MADTTATTATTETSEPSNFGGGVKRHTGNGEMSPEDSKVWEKHFGGPDRELEDEPAEKKPAKKPAAKTEAKEEAKPKAPKKDEKPAAKEEAKPAAKVEAKEDPEEEEAETEEPDSLTKAREKFKQAKKAKDTREARKLYREAMKEAFGEIPEEFNDARFATARDADRKRAEETKKERETIASERAAVETEKRNVEANAAAWVEKLRPAFRIHKRLENIRTTQDFTDLGAWMGEALELPPDEALKRFTRGFRGTPESAQARAAKAAAEEAKRASDERIAALEKRLAERDSKVEQETKLAKREAARAEYLEQLETDLAEHPITKVRNGFKRVLDLVIKTADKKLKAATLTPEQAADRIVAAERRRVKAHLALVEGERPDTEEQPAPRTVPRSQQASNARGQGEWNPDEAFDRIWKKNRAEDREKRARR